MESSKAHKYRKSYKEGRTEGVYGKVHERNKFKITDHRYKIAFSQPTKISKLDTLFNKLSLH